MEPGLTPAREGPVACNTWTGIIILLENTLRLYTCVHFIVVTRFVMPCLSYYSKLGVAWAGDEASAMIVQLAFM